MIKRAEDMVKLYNEHMRGGDGTVEIVRILNLRSLTEMLR